MIKKLNSQFFKGIVDIPCEEIAWAIEKGIVSNSDNDNSDFVSYPIYDDDYNISLPNYDIWKRLLVLRAVRDFQQDPQQLFEEVAEIAVAFGYPSDMNNLIYYMPAEEGGSEEVLMKRIMEYSHINNSNARQ
jgi:hypothetical protein